MTYQSNRPISPVPGKVRGFAAEKRIKQADLAATLNLSRMAIVRRLKGDVRFTDEELIALSERFDVPVGAFFGEVAA